MGRPRSANSVFRLVLCSALDGRSKMSKKGSDELSRRALRAACIGSLVEWFDFGIYAYMAPVIAVHFFPSGDTVASLLSAFALFAVAFVVRPLGGVVLGHFGDRYGRRGVLAFSIVSMGLATAAIGVLPTFATVGALAPVLLLLCRVVQGFSAGGEQMGAASFALEYASETRRGRCSGMLSASIVAGFLIAAILVSGLSVVLGSEAMRASGWRVPFLIALPLALIGLYLRYRIDDTPEFCQVRAGQELATAPVREAMRTQLRPMGLVFGGLVPFVVGIYLLLTYSPSYLAHGAGLSLTSAIGANAVVLALVAIGMALAGRLVDRHGTWRVIQWASLGYLVLAVPAFAVMGLGGVLCAVLGQLLLGVPVALSGAAVFTALVDSFPARVRFSAGSIAYNIAQAALGGTAPFVATFLVDRFATGLMPAFYIAALAVLSAPAVLIAQRSAGDVRPSARLGAGV
ncbi:MFS transporter [Saccharopolyspora shandongensis]|uniref:MFS transporter n=1 Tax=Saccharopolyspora shandongensis TaxID=418495 RepID=UPI0033C67442